MILFQVVANIRSNNVITELSSEQIAAVIKVGGGIHGVPDYKRAIVDLRGTTNKAKQADIKENKIPAFIPSVYYPSKSKGKDEPYTLHPYMMLDIDGKDNLHLAKQGHSFNKMLPGELIFNSPKADGGRKVLMPIIFRNEFDYPLAYEQLTAVINRQLVNRNNPEITFDKQAAKVTQLCLFSWDVNAIHGDETAPFEPAYSGIINRPQRGATSVLSEADWSSVDTSSVTALFDSTVTKLAELGTIWGSGTYGFLIEIIRLKLHGVGLAELLNLVHQHANGKYSAKHPKAVVTDKLSRLYNELFTFIDQPVTVAAAETNTLVFDQYLTEHLQVIWERLKVTSTLYIDAPTGAGKTTLIKALGELSGMKIDLLCPTTALAQQQTGNGVENITGDGMLELEHYSCSVLATCYESIAKVKKRQADILVIDEAHELASAYNYRSKHIQTLSEYCGSYKYVLYLSGSMFPIITERNKNQVLTFKRKQAKQVPYNLVTLGKSEGDGDYFAGTLKTDTLNVFYKNDKAQLTSLAEYLKATGLRVLMVSADTKSEVGYQALISDETLLLYDVVLTTCLLQSGVNVTDTRPVNIVFGLGCSVLDYIQFTARFRAVIPTIEIIHSGKVGSLFVFNESAARQQIDVTIKGLTIAQKINEDLPMNQKSYFKPAIIDGTRIDESGHYHTDEYFLLFKELDLLNQNRSRNKLFLQKTLDSFGFIFQNHILTTAPDLISETEQRNKALTKERREVIAAAIVAGSFTLGKSAGKEERELVERWKRLHYLEIWSVTAPMLIKQKEYSRALDRALYEHCLSNTAQGMALDEKAAVWYGKLDSIRKQVTPGTYSADTLKAIVKATTGKTHDQAVNDNVSIIYDIQKKRQRVDNSRTYEYQVTDRKAADITKRVGSIQITDDFFDNI